jgi:hypothetical protein
MPSELQIEIAEIRKPTKQTTILKEEPKMKTLKTLTLMLIPMMLSGAAVAMAATSSSTVTINAAVDAKAKLELSASTLTFPNSDPDTVPSIPSNEGGVTVTAKANTSRGSTVTLTLVASDDLKSGSDTIDIGNITWTGSGAGFVNGTMNQTTPQTVASWSGSGNHTGTVTHVLANSWDYVAGNYSATATYTLTAP